MCGIAGIIHKNKQSNIGAEMTAMLQALKHRGPDSSGFALYGPSQEKQFVLRLKVAEKPDLEQGINIFREVKEREALVEERMRSVGATIVAEEDPTEYAFRYQVKFDGELRKLADVIEDVEGASILSIGRSLELVKDLGDANEVAGQYGLTGYNGTHAIGHTRMATESDVDICSAHPFWAYPFSDISVVHNGQLTNYWESRRALERCGHRFTSDCDSEVIAVYLADKIERGIDLEEAMRSSVDDFDGVFTYLVATSDSLGMAKDTMAAKPMVLYEGDEIIALASEEVAIRSVIPEEIDTSDPYEGEVKVWQSQN